MTNQSSPNGSATPRLVSMDTLKSMDLVQFAEWWGGVTLPKAQADYLRRIEAKHKPKAAISAPSAVCGCKGQVIQDG